MTPSLRARAIALLARREYSRAELSRKLAGFGDHAEIAACLDSLEGEGYLSDRRYAESFVAARCARYGALRLAQDLRQRGIAEALIDEALAGAAPDEAEQARAVLQRRFPELPGDAREFARQARFLQARGFRAEVVRRLLSGRER